MESTGAYTVDTFPGRNKGLRAARNIKAGEVVLSDLPIILTSTGSSGFCTACLRTIAAQGAVPCTQCRQATFCSPDCVAAARSDAGGHSPAVCRVLAHLDIQGLSDEDATTLRFLVQAQALLQAAASDANASKRWEAFSRLSGGSLKKDWSYMQSRLSRATDAANASDSAGARALALPEVTDILTKEELNGYGIMAPSGPQGERRIRGTAIYPQASLLNHECLPNVARFDDFDSLQLHAPHNTAVHFRAMHDLPAGEELTQSYFPLNTSYQLRQQRCAEHYSFACTCPRCKEEATWPEDADADDWEPAEAMEEEGEEEDPSRADAGYIQVFLLKYMCPQPDCFGTMAPVAAGSSQQECSMCRHQRSEAEFLADLDAAMQQG